MSKREFFDMWATTSEDLDEKQNQNTFRIQVIDSPEAYSGPATTTDDVETLNKAGIDSKWRFMGRLLDNDMPHQKFLDDVCDSSVADNTNGLSSLHSRVTIVKAGALPAIGPGDILQVSCEAAGSNIADYDLQEVTFERVEEIFKTQNSAGKDITCADVPKVVNGKISANFGELGTLIGTIGTVGEVSGNGPGQKAVYIGGGNNTPITNGTLSDAGIISGATQGYLSGHPRVLTDVVSDWDAMAAAFAAHFSDKGWKLAGSGDRTYQRQVTLRAEWCAKGSCGKASKPGYSNHGWGLAVDTHYYDSSGEKKSLSFSGEAYKWLFDNAATYNWEHPYWAQKPSVSEKLGRPCVAPPNKKCGSNIEVWHWESTRASSLVRKGTAAYEEAVALAASSNPEDPPIEAGDGDESSAEAAVGDESSSDTTGQQAI